MLASEIFSRSRSSDFQAPETIPMPLKLSQGKPASSFLYIPFLLRKLCVMVYSRDFIPSSRRVSDGDNILLTSILTYVQAKQIHLRARLYPSTGRCKPVQALVPVRIEANKYFPIPEGLFQQASVQPYIHNCQVTILEGSSRYQFTIFFKNHCRLALNLTLPRNTDGVRNTRQRGPFFRGDLVILKTGVRKPFVNMGGRESAIADYAAKR
jgi:hypothetical protein